MDLIPIENPINNSVQLKVKGRCNKLVCYFSNRGLSGHEVIPDVTAQLAHPVNIVKGREYTADGWVDAKKPL